MIESILAELIVLSGIRLTEILLRSPREYVSKAIDDTASAFAQIENLRQSLTLWCDSPLFTQLLQRLESGRRDITQDEVVTSFLEASGFYHGAETQRVATEVLIAFFHRLVDQLYLSEFGPVAHAGREEVLHSETRGTVVRATQALQQELSQVKSEVLHRLSPDEVVRTRQDSDQILHARIDEARRLLESGKPVTARTLLERLKQEASGRAVSSEVHFRITLNLGACALQLDDVDAAEVELTHALVWSPENPKALTNLALVALQKEDPGKALDLAAIAWAHSKDSYVAAVYIQCLAYSGKRADLDELLKDNEWIVNDATCTLALGKSAYDQGDFGNAEGFLRRSLAIDDKNPQTMSLLALCLLEPVRRAFAEDPPLPWRLSSSDLSRLSEAEQLLTHSVDAFEPYENQSPLVMALTNRAVVYGFLGRPEHALKDCDRVLLEPGQSDVVLRNKGMLLLRMDRPLEAMATFERIVSPQEQAEIQFAMAQAYLEVGRYPEAAATLRQQWNPSSTDRRQILISGLLMHALTKAGQTEGIGAIKERLRQNWPNDPEAMSMAAIQLMRDGKTAESLDLLREALAYSSGSEKDRITLELADFHYRNRQYGQAAELYGQIVSDQAGTDILERYVTSLYNAGTLSEALAVAQRLRSQGTTTPLIGEVEALILQGIGDLKGAKTVLEGLALTEPADVSHRINLAMLDLRLGKRDTARSRLAQITYAQIKNDPHALLQVARARALLGDSDILPLVYRARRISFGDPDTHLAYLWFFMNRGPEDVPSQTGVATDSTVYLEGNGESLVLTIIDDEDADKGRGEIRASDPVASRLLGRRTGDEVVLRQTHFEERRYEVKDVQSKYVHAFRETLTNFGAWFPDHPGLHRMKFQENDFSRVFAALDSRYELMMQIRRTYQARRLTMGAIAQLLGGSVVEVWGGLIGWKDERLIASGGEPKDLQAERTLLDATDDIAMDLVALLTHAYLDLVDILPQRFRRILVAQAALDELNDALARNYLGARSGATIWKGEEGKYFKQEISDESLARGRAFLERVRSFVETRADLVPATDILRIGRRRFDEFRKVIGASSTASILIAREHAVPLYSDDLGLRIIARGEWGVSGVWTQTVLLNMTQRGVITHEKYCEAVVALALANYRFISLDSAVLLWLLRKNNGVRTEEVERVFSLLSGPECGEDSAIGVIVELMRAVWLDGFLYHQKLWIGDLSLNVLVAGRSASRVLARLRAALSIRFKLLPFALKPVLESIEIWERQSLLRSGRIIRP